MVGNNDSDKAIQSNVFQLNTKYFNPIRNRVGLPGLSDTEAASDETTLDNIIKREYMIEFDLTKTADTLMYVGGAYMKRLKKLVFMECVWEEINILIIRIRFL